MLSENLNPPSPAHDQLKLIVTVLLKEVLDPAFLTVVKTIDVYPRYAFQGHLLSCLNQQMGYKTDEDIMRINAFLIEFIAKFYTLQKTAPDVPDYEHLKTALKQLAPHYGVQFTDILFTLDGRAPAQLPTL